MADAELLALAENLNFEDPNWNDRFYDVLKTLRTECPLARSEHNGGFLTISRFEDIAPVLQDWRRFSSGGLSVLGSPERPRLLPTESDPPLHDEIRRLLNPFFLIKRFQDIEPAMRIEADALIDSFIAAGRCDAAADFASPFPTRVFFRHVINTPLEELPRVAAAVELVMRGKTSDELAQGFGDLMMWCIETLARRREEPPKDDLIDALTGGHIFNRPLTPEEQVWTLLPVTLGGLDTSASVIAFGIQTLATDPGLQQQLQDKPELLPAAIEEFFRMGSPAPTVRTLLEDAEVAGTTCPAGSRLNVAIYSANRDDQQFPDPDRVDLTRDERGNRHIAFGLGPHRCLGSNLARLSLRVAFEALLARVTDIRLDDGQRPVYQTSQMRSVASLPITFRAR